MKRLLIAVLLVLCALPVLAAQTVKLAGGASITAPAGFKNIPSGAGSASYMTADTKVTMTSVSSAAVQKGDMSNPAVREKFMSNYKAAMKKSGGSEIVYKPMNNIPGFYASKKTAVGNTTIYNDTYFLFAPSHQYVFSLAATDSASYAKYKPEFEKFYKSFKK